MTGIKILVAVFTLLIAASCSNGQNAGSLSPEEFAAKVQSFPTAPIIDVRTPGEYSSGHLLKATNIDWNSNSFMQTITQYDKKKPIFVYCQVGGRSSAAAAAMRSAGFKQVYEMAGGIRSWKEKLVK
ncbi:hypothetical protein BH10BAC6_BH10BAC6_11870 [soil metagenome]